MKYTPTHLLALATTTCLLIAAGCGSDASEEDNNGQSGGQTDTITSTFDTDDEGWSLVDLPSKAQSADPDYSSVVTTLELTHNATGGVDDSGYISHADATDDAFFFTAPSAYLGDKSAYLGGRLEFRLQSSRVNFGGDAAVVLEGAETTLATLIAPPDAGWSEFSVLLDLDGRTFHEKNLDGAAVDRATLAEVLSDLKALRISGEFSDGNDEVVGLDEVSLMPAE